MIEIPGPPFAPRLTFSLISARDERARHDRHLEQAVLGLGRDLSGTIVAAAMIDWLVRHA